MIVYHVGVYRQAALAGGDLKLYTECLPPKPIAVDLFCLVKKGR